MLKERRRYFRIVDTVEVGMRALSDDELTHPVHVLDDYVDIDSVASKLQDELLRLRQKHPELISLMALMNEKIDMVRGMIDRDLHPGHARYFQTREIDLSACGISFSVLEPVAIGTLMLIEINLVSPFRAARSVARVVGCDNLSRPDGENPYNLRLDFLHIHDTDQEMLIQYLMKRQVQELKERRDSLE